MWAVLLLSGAPTAVGGAWPALIAGSDPCQGVLGLRAWLCDASFALPDMVVPPGGGSTVQVQVKGLTCSRLSIGTVHSSDTPSAAWPKLDLQVAGAGMTCSTSDVKFIKPAILSGVGAAIDLTLSGASLSTALALNVSGGLAVGAQLQGTGLKIGKLSLHIHTKVFPGIVSGLVNLTLTLALPLTLTPTLPLTPDLNPAP